MKYQYKSCKIEGAERFAFFKPITIGLLLDFFVLG